jgi:hypothetical protein
MRKMRTPVTLGEEVLRLVRVRAARLGKADSEIIEESLRRDLGLDLLHGLWREHQMPEDEAVDLALEAQRMARHRGRA